MQENPSPLIYLNQCWQWILSFLYQALQVGIIWSFIPHNVSLLDFGFLKNYLVLNNQK